jgi:hypothetical protein
MAKFAVLAFSEVNPDNVSVYVQNTQAEHPGAALCMYRKGSFLIQYACEPARRRLLLAASGEGLEDGRGT